MYPYPDNGILGTVPGQYIAQASKQLPDPATATAERMTVTIEAGWVGPVRITYERCLAKHRKRSHWFWGAKRAEAIMSDAPG